MSETKEKDVKEIKDTELEEVTGGISVYSDNETITMYFSTSENPSTMMTEIKNNIQRQSGCFLYSNVTDTLQGLLNEMSNTKKTYLKINYKRDGEMITEISVNILL